MTQELKNLIHSRADAVQSVYHRHGRVFHALWLVAAIIVIAVGLVMTVLPGPAIIVIPVGVAMLAARFRWAQWLLYKTIDLGVMLHRRLSKASFGVRSVAALAVAAVAVGLTLVMLR
jgi:hypothetical protein